LWFEKNNNIKDNKLVKNQRDRTWVDIVSINEIFNELYDWEEKKV
jgi:hypothetical protein